MTIGALATQVSLIGADTIEIMRETDAGVLETSSFVKAGNRIRVIETAYVEQVYKKYDTSASASAWNTLDYYTVLSFKQTSVNPLLLLNGKKCTIGFYDSSSNPGKWYEMAMEDAKVPGIKLDGPAEFMVTIGFAFPGTGTGSGNTVTGSIEGGEQVINQGTNTMHAVWAENFMKPDADQKEVWFGFNCETETAVADPQIELQDIQEYYGKGTK
jgi:hypothetical protein